MGSERWGFIIVSTEPETTRWGLGLLELLLRGTLVAISATMILLVAATTATLSRLTLRVCWVEL